MNPSITRPAPNQTRGELPAWTSPSWRLTNRGRAREQDLRDQVEISGLFQVLVEAAPDAVLLLSLDGRVRILFVND